MAEKRRIKWGFVAVPVIFAALLGLFAGGMFTKDENLPSALIGKSAPSLAKLERLGTGDAVTDAMLRSGEAVLVNFWASWCAPCRVEHPLLEELAAEGVTIIGINWKDDPAKAMGFLEDLGDPYAALGADPEGRVSLNYGVYGLPETFVVAGDGTILARHPGQLTSRVVAEVLRPALAQ